MLQKTIPTVTGLTLGALAVAILPAHAFDLDSAEKYMSYSIGDSLRFRPELGVSTEFTDNLYYAGLQPKTVVANPSGLLPVGQVIVNGTPTYNFLVTDFIDAATGKKVAAGSQYFGPVTAITNTVNGNPTVSYYAKGVYALQQVTRVSPRNSELISSITPGFKFQYGDEVLNNASLSYGLTLSKYLVTGLEPTPQHTILFHTKLEYSRLKLELDSAAVMASSFLGGGQNAISQNTLVDRWNEDSKARLTYQLSTRISTYAEFIHDLVEYDSAVGLYGAATWQGNLGAGYDIKEDWKVFTEAHYGQTTVSPSSPDLPSGPHSVIYGGYIGTSGTFTPRFRGSIKFGYELREYPSIGAPAVGAPAVDATLTYDAGPSTVLNLNYSRRTNPSSQLAAQTYVFDNVTFGVNQGLGGSGYWWATFTAKYIRGDFSSLVQKSNYYKAVPGTPYYFVDSGVLDYGRTDDQIIMSVGLQYIPRPWLRASLTYEYENYAPNFRDSRLQGFSLPEYDNHRVTLSMNLGY